MAHQLLAIGLTQDVVDGLFKIEGGVLIIDRAELRLVAEILSQQATHAAA